MKQMLNIDDEITSKNYERELALCKEAGGDIERYRRLSFDLLQLEQIRIGLQKGLDVEQYMDPSLTWIEMENIWNRLETGIDIDSYEKEGYDWLQCNEIREGLKAGLDITVYEDIRFLAPQMKEIRQGLAKRLDVSIYAKPEYDWFQMREIRKGLAEGLDVSKYSNPEYKFLTMRAIRKALSIDVSLAPYIEKGYRGRELLELSRGLIAGNDISEFLENGFDAEQLAEINNAYEAGVNLIPHLRKDFYGAQLSEITKGLQKGLDVSVYAKSYLNWFQMREIRYGMEDRLDVFSYMDSDLSAEQMAEVRQGLLEGVDVTQYNKPYYEPEQMAQMRKDLKIKADKESRELQKALEEAELQEAEAAEEATAAEAKAAEAKAAEAAESKSAEADATEAAEGKAAGEEGIEDMDAFEAAAMAAAALEEAGEDGGSFVTISPNKMQAVLNLPAPVNNAEYSMEVIMRILKQHDIKQGIDKDRIQEMLEKKEYFTDVVVAKGKAATDGKNGRYLYYFRKSVKRKPKVLENGTVDYKDMELFETVKEGQLIAEYQPPTSGGFGYNVLGELIPPAKGHELMPLHGNGFMMSEDKKKYYSLMDGIIEWKNEGDIEIRNMFVLPGNVDASTGNINFDGDVSIDGNVETGFTVTAAGNVEISGYCEGAIIKAGKDILIRKGCQGQNTGELRAGGSIIGQFFESVNITAGDKVEASYLMNCNVNTEGKLVVTGRRGLILGGYACAKQGVECRVVGNATEVKTTIEVGIDKDDMARYQELMKKIAKLDSDIRTFQEAVSKIEAQGEVSEKNQGIYERLTKAIYAQKSQKKELFAERAQITEKLTRQKGARVQIQGSVFPGTKIIINTEVYKVTEEQRNIQFVKNVGGVDVVKK